MFRNILLLSSVIILSWGYADTKYTRIVRTTYGPIIGEEVHSDDGVKYKAFKGIPYARPPVGGLRFKAPEPPLSWKNTKLAVRYGKICHQYMQITGSLKKHIRRHFTENMVNFMTIGLRLMQQSEDCLSLNVYTTQLGEHGLQPVLVWFFGGGFYTGDGTDSFYGPDYLVNEEVVVVTINYRLGPIGFLSTNTSDASGNWGLKDQVAALKWVQDNIAQFGGDPKQVTIYGESAGGVAVAFHQMSPLSEGLFHKVISSSGTATCDWALNIHPERMSRNLARITGASEEEVEDPAARVDYLRNVPAKTLMARMWDVMEEQDIIYNTTSFFPFAPVLEPTDVDGAFVTEDPMKLMAEGRFSKVPLMMGFNDLEGGIMFEGASTFKSPSELSHVDFDVCQILPVDLKTGVEANDACLNVSQQILDVYFGGRPPSSSPLQLVYMFGDRGIIHPVRKAQKWFTHYSGNNSLVYLYYFTYDGEWNIMKNLFSIDLPGVVHVDDLAYVFKPKIMKMLKLSPTSPGYYTHKRMISFITNFVKYGNPAPFVSDLVPVPWDPANENELNTMVISADLQLEKYILKDRMDLWDKLFKEYVGTPYYY